MKKIFLLICFLCGMVEIVAQNTAPYKTHINVGYGVNNFANASCGMMYESLYFGLDMNVNMKTPTWGKCYDISMNRFMEDHQEQVIYIPASFNAVVGINVKNFMTICGMIGFGSKVYAMNCFDRLYILGNRYGQYHKIEKTESIGNYGGKCIFYIKRLSLHIAYTTIEKLSFGLGWNL